MRLPASLECQGLVAYGVQVLSPGRGTQCAVVPARNRWSSAGDLKEDGSVMGATRMHVLATNSCAVLISMYILIKHSRTYPILATVHLDLATYGSQELNTNSDSGCGQPSAWLPTGTQ